VHLNLVAAVVRAQDLSMLTTLIPFLIAASTQERGPSINRLCDYALNLPS